MKSISSKWLVFFTGFLLLSAILCAGCASTEMERYRVAVQNMSDDDLLNNYYGINARIKDIEYGIKEDRRKDDTRQQDFVSQSTFVIGGEGYRLVQKRDLLLKTLHKRHIFP
ncbi:MAG: hypothetical protein P8X55_02470 [Desulfosarcinaceae bacterium]|jgi:ABC-type uncharacterized transport system substrate-binding protein